MATNLPFCDPLNDLIINTSSLYDENPNPEPPEPQFGYPDPGHQLGHELDDILDLDDPLSDPFIWGFCNNYNNNNNNNNNNVNGDYGAGPSRFHGESSNHGVDVPMPLSAFAVPRSRYNCTFCQTLREITHTNGMNVKRLEIHGKLGIITHAVLGKYDFDSSFQTNEFQMFDFHKESTKIVRKFLIQYFETCKHEGYNTFQDPLSTFYEALSVGLNEPHNPDDFLQPAPENTDGCSNNLSKEGGNVKIPLSIQRARTRDMELKDCKPYFHLTMEKAAKKMNISLTVMKGICRRNGVLRWPYRKIKCVQNQICKKMKILESSDCNGERSRVLEDIRRHEKEIANIYEAYSR